MESDFFYAYIVGWVILLVFWIIVVIFIAIRKPPNSKLSNKILIYSILFFVLILTPVLFI